MTGCRKGMEGIMKDKKRGMALWFITALLLTGCGGSGKNLDKRIMEEEISIDGIQGEYELLFLTDSHVVTKDGLSSEEEKKYAEEREAAFRNEEGVSAKEQFSAWTEYANEEDVDGVILGGDIIDTPSGSNLEYLGERLSSLEMPYVYTPGNHDWTYPWEYMTEKGKQEYLSRLAAFMEGNTAIHSKDFGEFVVVAVDNSPGQVNEAALQEYEEILDGDKPVIVLVHVPFLTQSILPKAKEVWKSGVVIGGGNYGGIYPNEASEKFLEMTTDKDSPVEAVLAGHVHFYDRGIIDGEKDVPQIVGDAGFHGSAMRITVSG